MNHKHFNSESHSRTAKGQPKLSLRHACPRPAYCIFIHLSLIHARNQSSKSAALSWRLHSWFRAINGIILSIANLRCFQAFDFHIMQQFSFLCCKATWGVALRDFGDFLVLLILPTTTALPIHGFPHLYSLWLTPCCLICRFDGLPFVEFPCFNVVSNSFWILMSWLVNFVFLIFLFEFSPCFQGWGSGFAPVFKIPIQVVHCDSTSQQFKITLHLFFVG